MTEKVETEVYYLLIEQELTLNQNISQVLFALSYY